MRVIDLLEINGVSALPLQRELASKLKIGGTLPKVYSTFWRCKPFEEWAGKDALDVEYVFITTSKDLHLSLGRFMFNGLTELCRFLHQFLKDDKERQDPLILCEASAKIMISFVSMVNVAPPDAEDRIDRITYHLSQVNN